MNNLRKCCLLLLTLPLTACTDIRNRVSPDLLALEPGSSVRIAMHITEPDKLVTAVAESPLLLPEALQNAAGAEVSTVHLSLLMLSGNPAEAVPYYLEQGTLAPTCEVLYVPDSPCSLLESGDAPRPEQLRAAVDTGCIPPRTADRITGDLRCGSGVSALHANPENRLTLALIDENGTCGLLSEDACRGLALLENRWSEFALVLESGVCRVKRTRLRLSADMTDGQLCFTVSGTVRAETADPAALQARLSGLLRAALEETAADAGADILFLRETAIRDDIRLARSCTQTEWRALLRNACCETDISVVPAH